MEQMIQHTVTLTTTEVNKAQIWALMTDINGWKAWDNTIAHSELQGEFEQGATFILQPQGGPRVKIKLVEVQPKTYFKDLSTFPLAKMYGEHWYEDTPQGLKITTTMTMTGPLAILWNKLVMKDIVEHLEDDIKMQIVMAKRLVNYDH